MRYEKKADPFYLSGPWLAVREQALIRDHYDCQDCLKLFEMGRKLKVHRATMVHHLKPRKEHPELELELGNLISLCDSCHNKRHPERGFKHQMKEGPGRRCVTIKNERSLDRDG